MLRAQWFCCKICLHNGGIGCFVVVHLAAVLTAFALVLRSALEDQLARLAISTTPSPPDFRGFLLAKTN